jgi:iron(III) transport system ATP-binding protein
MTSIVLESISKAFGDARAVDSVNLQVKKGEFVTLLGPSGCGKTTTLRMVAGLEQNDGGVITIGDRVVSDPASGVFVQPDRRQLGMVFQSYAIWPHMTVFANVAYPLEVRRRKKSEVHAKVMAALKLVEMESFVDRPAPALSGGQQQRVAIARALVAEPEVLLLDEPLSNLDAKLRVQMGDEFRHLQKRLGITCLYVTHDQAEALALSDRIVVMQKGRVLQVDTPEQVYFRPATVSVAAFLGTPNLLDADVTALKGKVDGMFQYAVAGSGWRGMCVARESFQAGDRAVMSVRPEDIQIVGPGSEAGDNETVWKGRVIDSVFRGAKRNLIVDVDGTSMNVEAPARNAPAVGDAVTLTTVTRNIWGLRPQKDGQPVSLTARQGSPAAGAADKAQAAEGTSLSAKAG